MLLPSLKLAFMAAVLLIMASPLRSFAEETPPGNAPTLPERLPLEPMTVDRLDSIVRIIDPEAARQGNVLSFQVVADEDLRVTGQIITDIRADRMRIIVGIGKESSLSPEIMKRALQANFDSALDARYAIAQGYLWSTFIHPLSPLGDEEFVSGISQTVTAAITFGTTYSSGALVFGGGDSEGITKDLLEEYRRKARPKT